MHFLHLGKTGGIAIKHALQPIADQYSIALPGHGFTLGDRVIFSIRSPVTRFVNGFNSRLRGGQHKLFSPWRFGEQDAFVRFLCGREPHWGGP